MEPLYAPVDAPSPVSEGTEFVETFRRAFARQPKARGEEGFQPLSLTVALSREAGSRGGTIARAVGRKLGWQVYQQELLEYLAQERHLSRDLFDILDDAAAAWIEERLENLLRQQNLSQNASIVELARVILAIGARGDAVIVGRGAGCLLPPASTLHVRVIAPLAERISYMSQLERLTREQAAEQVELRDAQRAAFIETHFHRRPSDIYQYDLLVNSSLLGEDLSAELIAQAARVRLAARGIEAGVQTAAVPEPLA
jgi:cytidylate kinase